MRILITGSKGQLGFELLRRQPENVEIQAVDIDELDITEQASVDRTIEEFQPNLIINAAAYTAVDQAESEPELAFAINAEGPSNLARAARKSNARLVHISTDFVFDGNQALPWKPQDTPRPLGIYGESKLQGEKNVRRELGETALILRTSWLYSVHGKNFVKTMLRLMAEKESICVVSDQVGSPTWAGSLADIVWIAADNPSSQGTLHWTDAGIASWYDFAVAIQEEAIATGLLNRRIPVRPISTNDYPTPAKRPSYSVLDLTKTQRTLRVEPIYWRTALRSMLKEMRRVR